MKFYHSIILAIIFSALLSACDEGRIYNDYAVETSEGGVARFSAEVSGIDSWSQGYTIALAGFEKSNDYAIISKNVETFVTDGNCDVTLSGIPADVTTIELCAIDRLRRRVATFFSADYTPQDGSLQLTSGQLDISMATAIQKEIFNTTCVQCHGGNGYAAAGLNLLEGNSYGNLISVPSRKIPGTDRVKPGESGVSELFMILGSDISADWNYDHSVEVVRPEKIDLIRNWINNLKTNINN